MLEFFKNRSEFLKNISKLVAGTAVAQAISLLIAPFITRLYTPADFGTVTFLLSIAGGFSLIASFRYEMAIVLPKKLNDSANLAFLSLILALLVFSLLMIFLIFFDYLIIPEKIISSTFYKGWKYLLPVIGFLLVAGNVFQHWFNLRKEYRSLAWSKIINSAGNNLTTLLLGLTGIGTLGLWLGNFAGLVFATFFFVIVFLGNSRATLSEFNLSSQKALARKYKYLPLVNTPQVIIEMVQSYGLIYLLQIFFSSTILGWYSLAQRLLQAPMGLIGGSIGQVYYKEASEQFQRDGNLTYVVFKTIKTSTVIALPVLIILMAIGPWAIGLVFGNSWREAGEYARILAPWMFFDFIRSTIHQTPLIIGKARIMFYFSIAGATLIIIPICIGGILFKDIKTGLILLSAMQSLYSLGVIVWIVSVVKKQQRVH